ncbi:HLA class II histocompatibility antigen, DP alpha 1 chain-like, partial [Pimephales promelas]|uniref:HLA class II histocompatibility antigen, DP alpha 1 chain-like n=1 Tax=Pimephales promelas TaxID=90988 RepID=UPI001955C6F2
CPVSSDPPETSIYPQNDVQPGVENALICHVTGFFPPPVNVSWTKNNVMVTEGVSLSQSRPRTDGVFHVFSSLKIIPEHRDIYSCTVNHRALQRPQTKIWVLFCGLGMTLALLGMATGICFCIKAAATDRSDLAKQEKKAMQWIYQ